MDKKAVIQMVCCMTIQPGNKERMIRMKKRLLIGLTVLGIVFIAGCSGNSGTTGTAQNSASSGTASGGTEAVTPQVTDDTDTTVSDAAGAGQGQSSASDDIGEEQARATAVEHAGLTADDVTFIKVQLDRDDGRTVYDVEFYYGNTEYDYEIDAASGEVVSYDQDIENYNIQAQAAENVISLEQAKEAALTAAGLDASSVKWVKEKLDYDDGRSVYELECISGEMEYDFEINGADGTVLEQDSDSVYD